MQAACKTLFERLRVLAQVDESKVVVRFSNSRVFMRRVDNYAFELFRAAHLAVLAAAATRIQSVGRMAHSRYCFEVLRYGATLLQARGRARAQTKVYRKTLAAGALLNRHGRIVVSRRVRAHRFHTMVFLQRWARCWNGRHQLWRRVFLLHQLSRCFVMQVCCQP